jgi:hypothetical protein
MMKPEDAMKRFETAASALLLASSLVLLRIGSAPAAGHQAPKTDAAKIANAVSAAPPCRVAPTLVSWR